MDTLTMMPPRAVADDTYMMSAYIPVPTLGVLPANAFLIRGEQPVLIDTGVLSLGERYFEQLAELVAPGDLRWIWLTHLDPDHLGCLARLLDEAPAARVVTTFLGMGKLNLVRPVAPERFYLINPGQSLDIGDRLLVAVQPPTYDAPESLAVFDGKSRALLSSDSFGGLLAEPAESAQDVPRAELREGIVRWTAVDVPWLSRISSGELDEALAPVLELDPVIVLSSHLPPAPNMVRHLAESVAFARLAQPFVGPDQAALSQMLASASGASPP
jgi:hypothetical protein